MKTERIPEMVKILDSNVFIHGRGNFEFDEVITVAEVLEELESKEAMNKIENLDYRLEKPSKSSLEKVKTLSDDINSPTSETDEKLVALAMDRDLELVSDDRAVQNLCVHLDVDFSGFLDDSTDRKVVWRKRCENCGSEASGECRRCGSESILLKQVDCS